MTQARAIALQAGPGQVTDRELEKESCGGLRWSFDIKSGAKTYEVGVDAQTGKVLENKAEGAHPDQGRPSWSWRTAAQPLRSVRAGRRLSSCPASAARTAR
ncbi:PepSY domain-containing protein [Phenylobacterium sp.]|uniref:PepSY domain-containing protein n=1 Tax=Phenylobacterium sp. TaxID=1871053 RepID=UPI002F413A00